MVNRTGKRAREKTRKKKTGKIKYINMAEGGGRGGDARDEGWKRRRRSEGVR